MNFEQSIKLKVIRIRHSLNSRSDGGPGSGNWGHKGREGKVGGSEKGGGTHNRTKDENGGYTSFNKERRKAALPHALTEKDLRYAQVNGAVFVSDGKHYSYSYKEDMMVCTETGKRKYFKPGDEARVIIPNSVDPSYKLSKEEKEAVSLNQKRFEKATFAKTREEADKLDRERSGRIWKSCDKETKLAIQQYTGNMFEDINSYSREGDEVTKKWYGFSDKEKEDAIREIKEKTNRITEAIDKSELPEDRVYRRGISSDAAERLFGLPEGYLATDDPDEVSLTGRVGTDKGFMSCGSSMDSGTSDTVSLEILAPKGTKALYVEPFSFFGEGDIDWNGEDPQKEFSDDTETTLQRGTTLQILGNSVSKDSRGLTTHVIRAVVVRQDPEPFD